MINHHCLSRGECALAAEDSNVLPQAYLGMPVKDLRAIKLVCDEFDITPLELIEEYKRLRLIKWREQFGILAEIESVGA